MLVNNEGLKNFLHVDNYYDIILTNDIWKVQEIKKEYDYSSYILYNTLTGYGYQLNCVFGLEQISDDEFVAFNGALSSNAAGEYCHELLRYHLNENSIIISEVLPKEYGWTPADGQHNTAIVVPEYKNKIREKAIKTS